MPTSPTARGGGGGAAKDDKEILSPAKEAALKEAQVRGALLQKAMEESIRKFIYQEFCQGKCQSD